jgi:DNA repair protein SbcC/Rad50
MRLEQLRIRGIGPFREEVRLDLADLGDATLVAVCGDNGEGKSTWLEFAIPGAFYRRTPTQGSLKDRATARDSLLEVVVTGSERFTIRHLMDGVSGKGESVVLDHANRPVYGTTKVSDFDAWSAKTLPPEEVLLASTFGAQQDRGFLGAEPSERKAILLRALGISRYEAWAALASKRAGASKQALEVTRARLDEARRTGGDLIALGAAVEAAALDAKRLDDELSAAKAALALLESRVREAEASAAAHAAHVAKQVELRARVQTFEGKRDDLDARIAACNRTLSQEAAIRDAAAKLSAVQEQMNELVQKRATLNSREETALERRRSSHTQAEGARTHHARVAIRIADLEGVLAKGAEIAQAERDLREVEEGLVVLRQGVQSAQSTLDELTAAAVAGAEERVGALRDGLEVIGATESLDVAQSAAKECLDDDDATLREASERPAKLAAARKAVEQCRGLVSSAEKRQQQLAALARRAGEVTAAREQLASLKAELAQHAEAARSQAAQAEQAAAQAKACTDELNALSERHRALGEQAGQLRPIADQLPNVALAASKLEERKAQRAEVAGELEAATWALSQLGPAPAPATVPDVAPQRAKVESLERGARAAHQAVAVAASKLEGARAVEQQVLALEALQRDEETELGDWTRLAADLGRQGLQAAEIDGCGPELTALVNDLLHSAHGARFTVRIDTQKLSADGKKTLEGCQVTVIDTVKGREEEGKKFSGGERVIIGEALALGLSMLACQRSGLRGITLVRDETGAALDPGNAEVYVKMLRRAAKQIGADRVLFVCHNPEVSDLADARIVVKGGQLLIDAPARVAAA